MSSGKIKLSQNPKVPISSRGTRCLNCGHLLELSDRFCSHCGQLNRKEKISLRSYFREFIGSIVNYDSRFRYTIHDLLFKPGTITHNYINGQRIRYSNPFRFYLSVSILFFLLAGLLNYFETPPDPSKNLDLKKVFTATPKNFNKIPIDSIAYYMEQNTEKKGDTLETQSFQHIPVQNLDSLPLFSKTKTKISLFREFNTLTKITKPGEALDSLNYPLTRTNIWLYKKSASINKILDDPLAFWSYIKDKTPLFIFFFTPFYALAFVPLYIRKEPYEQARGKIQSIASRPFQKFLKIPYLGSFFTTLFSSFKRYISLSFKHNYIEHVIFIFHIFSFMFLGLLVLAIPDFIWGDTILSLLFVFVLCPFYFYKALRNFYKESRLRTLLKFVILNIVFFILSSLGALLFLLISAATY